MSDEPGTNGASSGLDPEIDRAALEVIITPAWECVEDMARRLSTGPRDTAGRLEAAINHLIEAARLLKGD